jgi:hypothetical protein
VEFASIAPGPCHALLTTVGERHGPRPSREAEPDLATCAEECLYAGQRRRIVKEFLSAGERSREARHATGLRGLADPGSFRNLLRTLATASLGGKLSGPSADLTEVLFVGGHGGESGAF